MRPAFARGYDWYLPDWYCWLDTQCTMFAVLACRIMWLMFLTFSSTSIEVDRFTAGFPFAQTSSSCILLYFLYIYIYMAYHSLPKQDNINEIKGFLHSNSIGVDTLQVHSRLFIYPNKFKLHFLYPAVWQWFVTASLKKVLRLTVGVSLWNTRARETETLSGLLFFVQLTVQLSKSSQIYVLKYFISEHV